MLKLRFDEKYHRLGYHAVMRHLSLSLTLWYAITVGMLSPQLYAANKPRFGSLGPLRHSNGETAIHPAPRMFRVSFSGCLRNAD